MPGEAIQRKLLDAAPRDIDTLGYYAWRGWPESPRKTANRALLAEIRSLHLAHRGRYGAPRVHVALRDLGHTASRGRIERLMRHHGIRAITARRFRTCTTDSRHDWPIAPNRLNQNFAADRPNQVWLADITYVPTSEGWLYLAVVLDLFTRKIVGWAMRDHMRAELTIAALTMAIQRQKPPPGLIHHSDRSCCRSSSRGPRNSRRLPSRSSNSVARARRRICAKPSSGNASECAKSSPRTRVTFQQLTLDFGDEEKRQLESDMRSWRIRLEQFDRDLEREPQRVRAFYEVRAKRVEPVGLVYLWPETN